MASIPDSAGPVSPREPTYTIMVQIPPEASNNQSLECHSLVTRHVLFFEFIVVNRAKISGKAVELGKAELNSILSKRNHSIHFYDDALGYISFIEENDVKDVYEEGASKLQWTKFLTVEEWGVRVRNFYKEYTPASVSEQVKAIEQQITLYGENLTPGQKLRLMELKEALEILRNEPRYSLLEERIAILESEAQRLKDVFPMTYQSMMTALDMYRNAHPVICDPNRPYSLIFYCDILSGAWDGFEHQVPGLVRNTWAESPLTHFENQLANVNFSLLHSGATPHWNIDQQFKV